MRRISYLMVATILTWLLFLVCVYVFMTAPELRYFVTRGGANDWISQNYRQLGIFLMGVCLFLLVIALLITFFFVGNVRISMSLIQSQQEAQEKSKRQSNKKMNEVLSSLNEDDIAELRDLLVLQDEEQSLLRREQK